MRWRGLRAVVAACALGAWLIMDAGVSSARPSLGLTEFTKPGFETYGDPDLGNGGARFGWHTVFIYRLRESSLAFVRKLSVAPASKSQPTKRSGNTR